MTKIYLIRHAEAEGNLYRRIQGHWDGSITPLGLQQIDALAQRFRREHIDALYCSDLSPARATAEAITRMTDRIEIVSAERVRDELTKLLLSDRPRAGIEALVDSGLADVVLPEIPALRLEIDEHHRHKDVFDHTMIVVDRAVALETGPDGPVPAPDLVLRLAALMHDIGKPKTRRFEPGGKVSFHHHDAVGAKMTRKRLKALRFDHHVVEQVSDLVDLHLRFHGYVEEPWTDSAVRRYVKDAGPLYERLNRLTRADTTTQNKRKAMMFSAAMDEMEQRVRDLKEKEDFDAIRPDLNGDEIMQLLSIEPGPMVGFAACMEQCAWNSSNTKTRVPDWGSAGFSYCLYRFRLAVSFADSPHHVRAPWAGRSSCPPRRSPGCR